MIGNASINNQIHGVSVKSKITESLDQRWKQQIDFTYSHNYANPATILEHLSSLKERI